MARLAIMHGDDIDIPGLGSNKAVPELSQVRITTAVREALRIRYGLENVRVCNAATLRAQVWRGRCWIDGTEHPYSVMETSYGLNN